MAPPFAVRVATDLYGAKHNILIEFSARPTMMDLIAAVEAQYDTLARAIRPPGGPDVVYQVETMQVYDDILQRWVDLYSGAQLSPSSQVFCFQPNSGVHSDVPDVIPEPTRDVSWRCSPGSPPRAVGSPDAAELQVSPQDKLRAVFSALDSGGKGHLLYSDLCGGLERSGMQLTATTAHELFAAADADRDGRVSYAEWLRFAAPRPRVVDALYLRAPGAAASPQRRAAPRRSGSSHPTEPSKASPIRQREVSPQPPACGAAPPRELSPPHPAAPPSPLPGLLAAARAAAEAAVAEQARRRAEVAAELQLARAARERGAAARAAAASAAAAPPQRRDCTPARVQSPE
eukprot:TRINITY_DN24739_c1_g1_i1.p1 TRINITY_DN24739_c1_g1~~TRINITY_DN24739_c1_g1_i1.p1  ORF type:complete len:373 (+),score=86.45 TRINITY_DN24739_c1_g1_i1:84-1121(+)